MKTKRNQNFLINFFRNPLQNGSVVPSSRQATEGMFQGVDLSQCEYVVELGPGTGVFTHALYRGLPSHAQVMVVELESSYISSLKERYGDRFEIVENSASELTRLIEERGWPRVDLIVSGLPFTMPKEVKRELWSSIDTLTTSGATMRWFTYFPWIMRWYYRKFPIQKVKFVPGNFPPLWVFTIN